LVTDGNTRERGEESFSCGTFFHHLQICGADSVFGPAGTNPGMAHMMICAMDQDYICEIENDMKS
jgi:hypothetical protein